MTAGQRDAGDQAMTVRRRPARAFMVPADFFESNEHDDMVAGLKVESANSAVVGWFRLLAAAKRRNEGTFASEAQLRQVLGHSARWLTRFRDIGVLNDLTVRDWDLWQEDQDSEATRRLKERQHRDRERKARKRAGDRPAPVETTGPVGDALPASGSAGRPPEPPASDRPSAVVPAQESADSPRTSERGDDRSGDETKVPSPVESDAWAGFGEVWASFREAWSRRGLTRPPTRGQRAVLWGEGERGGAIRDWPTACGRWVTDAPAQASAREVVAYVLARYHDVRGQAEPAERVDTDPSPPEAAAALQRLGEILTAAGAPSPNRSGGSTR